MEGESMLLGAEAPPTQSPASAPIVVPPVHGRSDTNSSSTSESPAGKPALPPLAPMSTQPAGMSAEEKERRLAEARSIAALKLQRKQRLNLLVHKRKTNLAYLKKVHQGNCYWLNATMFSSDDIAKYVRSVIPKARAEAFFCLGLSASRILSLPAGVATVRACAQLVEEFEYYLSGTAMQSVKYFTAKPSACVYPQSQPVEGMVEVARPVLFRFHNNIVYEYLQVPFVSFDLDYVEVLLSLCDALTALYSKLQHEDCFNQQMVYDTVVRFDARMKHHVINLIAKELTELAGVKMRSETASLRSLTTLALSSM